MLRAVWRGWLIVARTIGHVQSRIVLTLVYFVAVAPFALAVRLFSDPLGLHGAPGWHALPGDGGAVDVTAARQQF